MVILDAGDDDFLAVPVTSQQKSSAYDLALKDWNAAGLNIPSFVRVHKLTVLAKSDVARTLGQISELDRKTTAEILCLAFCPKH